MWWSLRTLLVLVWYTLSTIFLYWVVLGWACWSHIKCTIERRWRDKRIILSGNETIKLFLQDEWLVVAIISRLIRIIFNWRVHVLIFEVLHWSLQLQKIVTKGTKILIIFILILRIKRWILLMLVLDMIVMLMRILRGVLVLDMVCILMRMLSVLLIVLLLSRVILVLVLESCLRYLSSYKLYLLFCSQRITENLSHSFEHSWKNHKHSLKIDDVDSMINHEHSWRNHDHS